MTRFNIVVVVILSLLLTVLGNTVEMSSELNLSAWTDFSTGILDFDLQMIDVNLTGSTLLTASPSSLYVMDTDENIWRLIFLTSRKSGRSTIEELSDGENESNDVLSFDRSDYDADDLYRDEILSEDEDIDDIDDEELMKRLEDAGLLEQSEEQTPDEPQETVETTEITQVEQILEAKWSTTDELTAYILTSNRLIKMENNGINWQFNDIPLIDRSSKFLSMATFSNGKKLAVLSNQELIIVNTVDDTFVRAKLSDPEQSVTLVQQPENDFPVIQTDRELLFINSLGAVRSRVMLPDPKIQMKDVSVVWENEDAFCTFGESVYYYGSDKKWAVIPRVNLLGSSVTSTIITDDWIGFTTSRGFAVWNRSTKQFQFVTDGLSEIDIRDVTVNPRNPLEIWLVTASGVYTNSTDRILEGKSRSKKVSHPGLPDLEQLINSAVTFAEIDISRQTEWSDSISIQSFFPRLNFRYKYYDFNWEGYAWTDVIALSSGTFTIGPIDEVYLDYRKDHYDLSLNMYWDPEFFAFSKSKLKVKERLSKELSRRSEVIQRVVKLYNSLSSEFNLPIESMNLSSSLERKLINDQMIAELDAMTGFVYDFSGLNNLSGQ